MAVYIFGQPKDYAFAGLDYAQAYQKLISEEIACPIRYICTELVDAQEVKLYEKAEISLENVLGIYSFFTDNDTICSSVKVEDKLEELKNTLKFTGIDKRDLEIRLIKDGYVIAIIMLDEKDRKFIKGICYYAHAKLLRMEIYTSCVAYVNYYVTAKSQSGLYAKLVRRTFYNKDASVVYEQIFEKEKEWYLFSDGRRLTKLQFIAEFIKKMNLTKQDMIVLDESIPCELMQMIFTFGKRARIAAIAYAGCYFRKEENGRDYSLLNEYPYYWFRYSEMLDMVTVSTEMQKITLTRELEKYNCKVPDIRVVPVEGEFVYITLYEAYKQRMALSWIFNGKPDGFYIFDRSGNQIWETRNGYCHYYSIEGYRREDGFIIKAYVDTLQGKVTIAESEEIYLGTIEYKEPVVSLVIPVYNAENYLCRALDQALAQSVSDLEIIVVDDGSRDSTAAIAAWYAERYSNVRFVRQENAGPSAARNVGIKYANGTYLGFMDSDDMIRPDMISGLYNSAKRNQCDIAITSAYAVTDKGYTKFLKYTAKEDFPIKVELFFHMFSNENVYGDVVWNKLYRTFLVKERMLPLIPYEDTAWTPYILSYADTVCYLDDFSYEWDRSIRSSTLSSKVNQCTKSEMFAKRKDAVLFYLDNGNPEKMKLLKENARIALLRWEREFANKEYGRLWQEIEKRF